MKTWQVFVVAALAMVAWTATELRADSLLSPSWRNGPGTTYTSWDFLTSSTTPSAETANNSYGTASAAVSLGYGASGYWTAYPPIIGGNAGVWDLGRGVDVNHPADIGRITLTLPCGSAPGVGTTDLWVQVVYYSDITGAPAVDVVGAGSAGSQDYLLTTVPGWGAWRVSLTQWQFSSVQTSATINVTGNYNGTMADQIIVDSQAVPEPATMTLLGLGLVGLFVRRGSRRS